MANLKVTLIAREPNGKRNWVKATPGMSLYLRYGVGNKTRYEFVGTNWDDACIAQMRKEKVLRAASQGFLAPEEPVQATKSHRIADTITAYIAHVSKPDKNGELRSEKSINSTQSELTKFHTWSGKTYMEELTRPLLEKWRDELNTQYEPDTVVNKLMTVATFWKHNPVCPHEKALLPASEFPDKKETIPDPYTEDEFNGMLKVADYEEGLLLHFFAVTGMREQEIAHAEREDINWDLGIIRIVKKEKFGWTGKTKAARREVPLEPSLLDELRLKGTGLLFPNASGQPHSKFLRDVIEPIARQAGVSATTDKPDMVAAGMVKNDWCHRFRDTYLTNSLHFCKNSMADLLMLCKRVGHKDTTTLDRYFGKLAKPYQPQLRLRKAAESHGIRVVA